MSRSWRRLALIAAVLLLAVGALLWREQVRRQQARAELERIAALRERSAPPIRHVDRADALFAATLPRAEGGDFALGTLRGRLLVVNFWASWCPPCIAEMPGLSQFARQHPEVQLVGVAVDDAKPVHDFLQRSPVSYPVLVAGDRGIDLIDALGDVQHDLPYTVVIGADGRVVAQHLGRIDPEALQRLVERR
ncbi:thiol-disulfide oxidoreductase ResA [mine drainage metagenome]|jgi:thiol-disulfide isomerase/thioredoxin|uniref:Thiol-disulfide oxidoreductase ResA n=1 Tax=mine drainage metagenome TaxID=410659 RepID=A0A1J5Q0K1_9ZZZZ